MHLCLTATGSAHRQPAVPSSRQYLAAPSQQRQGLYVQVQGRLLPAHALHLAQPRAQLDTLAPILQPRLLAVRVP